MLHPVGAANDPDVGAAGADDAIQANAVFCIDESLPLIHPHKAQLVVKEGCTVRPGDVIWISYGPK